MTRWLNLFVLMVLCASCQDQEDVYSSVELAQETFTPPSVEDSAQSPPDDRTTVRALRYPVPDRTGEAVLDSTTLARLSEGMIRGIGEGIGQAKEASFLDGGRLVVVLDRYEPFLRLFTADGDPLWQGGRKGGGPKEFEVPLVLFTEGDSVTVFQAAGRISHWVLNSDTLAFHGESRIPRHLHALGAEKGCGGETLLYARNDAQLAEGGSEIEYLYSLEKPFGSTTPRLMWAQERKPDALQTGGHVSRLLDRDNDRIVVFHRWNSQTAGEILEMDCEGNLLRRHSELSLAIGDTIEVLEPTSRVLEWTNGIVAIPDGFITAQPRYYSRRFFAIPTRRYRTELFLFLGGRLQGSMLVPRQWLLMDSDPRAGVLMTSNNPKPHFVRIPLKMITNSIIQGEDS